MLGGEKKNKTKQEIEGKPKILIIAGPTGVGKSQIGINIAKKINGEIISADSIQIYKDLSVGSNKLTDSQMEGIPHHLIGTVDLNAYYTVADYFKEARDAAKVYREWI